MIFLVMVYIFLMLKYCMVILFCFFVLFLVVNNYEFESIFDGGFSFLGVILGVLLVLIIFGVIVVGIVYCLIR